MVRERAREQFAKVFGALIIIVVLAVGTGIAPPELMRAIPPLVDGVVELLTP